MSRAHVIQAIILAGGRSTRLGRLTETTPKPLLVVDGIPFLEHVIIGLREQEITEVVIASGYLGGLIEQCLGSEKQLGVRVRHVCEPFPLGTGGGVAFAMPHLPFPDQPFVVCNADSFIRAPIQQLAADMVAKSTPL